MWHRIISASCFKPYGNPVKNTNLFTVLILTILTTLITTTAFGQNSKKGVSAPPTHFKNIKWEELIPKEDLDVLMSPPAYLDDIEDGSPEDRISGMIQNQIEAAMDDRYQQALVSTNIKPEMNNAAVRLAGFVVPLEFNDDQVITEFFLVPFFGACIHVPPPPPNQILYAKYPKGFTLENLYDPFWVSGTLKTTLMENDMATSAYTIEIHSVELYEEFYEETNQEENKEPPKASSSNPGE
ncbi:MAG: DUF3299 domain-containing protein [Cellvibrionaceae bacterium]